ncbi:MAG: hypothetical protein OEY19_10705 [Gammaproteobacteria bacterium]|nr:hypothetical protein [Gammaproteobacteria bacterium]
MKFKIAFLLCFMSIGILANESTPKTIDGKPVVKPEDDNSEVVLELYENQDLPVGSGFSVFVKGWYPNDNVTIFAIGPKEEKVFLLDENVTLPVSGKGKLEFSLPYKHNKLYKGQWVLVVLGKSGGHAHIFNVP